MIDARPVNSSEPTKHSASSSRVFNEKNPHHRSVCRQLNFSLRVLAPPRRLLPSAIPPNNDSTVKNKYSFTPCRARETNDSSCGFEYSFIWANRRNSCWASERDTCEPMRRTAPVRSAKLLVALPQLGSIQTDTSGKVNTKLSGSTPITMPGRSSTEIVLPTMLRSELSCASHKRWLITTQPAHVVSSAGVKSRPLAALLPNRSKKFGETRALKSLI